MGDHDAVERLITMAWRTQAMLASDEYAAIKADYDDVSRTHFPQSYFHPDQMSFGRSDALFPPADLAESIGREYDAQ